jgi:trk system potassium uptake protein
MTLVLLEITPFSLDTVLFEVTSAFGTVGLSTGMPRRRCRARAMAAL